MSEVIKYVTLTSPCTVLLALDPWCRDQVESAGFQSELGWHLCGSTDIVWSAYQTMLPPPEKCSQCGHPLGIAMRPTLQVLMGSAITTVLLLLIDPLFTLSWALRLVRLQSWELLLPRALYATSNQGRYMYNLSHPPAVSSPSNRSVGWEAVAQGRAATAESSWWQ